MKSLLWLLMTMTAASSSLVFKTTEQITENAALRTSIDELAKVPQLESARVGERGAPSDVYRALQRIDAAASAPEKLALAFHLNPVVRLYFAQAWIQSTPAQVAALEPLLSDTTKVTTVSGCIVSDEPINLSLTQTLLQSMQGPAVQGLLERVAARDDLGESANQALTALAHAQDTRMLPVARARLLAGNGRQGDAAIEALGYLKDTASAPRLLALAADAAPDRRRALAGAFGKIQTPQTLEALKQLLADPDRSVRRVAARAYVQLPEQDAGVAKRLLADPDAQVRDEAIEGLLDWRTPDIRDALEAVLLRPGTSGPKKLSDPSPHRPPVFLRRLLASGSETVVGWSARGLAAQNDRESLPAIRPRVSGTGSLWMRTALVDALVALHDDHARPVLEPLLGDPNPNGRLLGARALLALKIKAAAPAVRETAAHETTWAKQPLSELAERLNALP